MTSTDTARQVLRDLYGLDAQLSVLYGEVDDNFLVESEDGKKRILKIMHVGCAEQRVDLQCQAMAHLAVHAPNLNLPRVVPTRDGRSHTATAVDGVDRLVWLLNYCPGTLLGDFKPHDDALIRSFGRTMGLLDVGLKSFTHPAMQPGHRWEMTRTHKIRPLVSYVDGDAATLVDAVLQRFEDVTAKKLTLLRHSVLHNDANDYNVLVNVTKDGRAVVDGLIDFGDMSFQPTICEVAIALAYALLDKTDPLAVCTSFLQAYNEVNPLRGDELAVLYDLIMTRLAVSITIVIASKLKDPAHPERSSDKKSYIQTLSRLSALSPRVAECQFRQACSLPVIENADRTTRFIESGRLKRSAVIRTDGDPIVLDLSHDSRLLGENPGNLQLERLTELIDGAMRQAATRFAFGRYAEPRAIYNNAHFGPAGEVDERRTVHLGIDIFCPAESPVYTPLDGTVQILANNIRELDYGPMIVLRHVTDTGDPFFTLYGHLSPGCLDELTPGQALAAGEQIATVGSPPGNGNWPPHLHLQIILDLLDLDADFPGVARASQQDLWCELSPSPACFFEEFDPSRLRYAP